MIDEPAEIEIDGEGTASGINTLASQLATFTETLDGGRYELTAEIREINE